MPRTGTPWRAKGPMAESDYVIRVLGSPLEIDGAAWDDLLASQAEPTPFMRHAYFAALHTSGCAIAATGWSPHFITVESQGELVAACPLYTKAHSYGEYVFDWAWANAYAQHGMAYYPKAVVAIPFTPVPGTRMMARTPQARAVLVDALVQWCKQNKLSSLHLLFESDADRAACAQAGLMLRHTVQFHWTNTAPNYPDFEAFLGTLAQDKRKKIRQERRKVAEADVTFHWSQGQDICDADWDFFYRCYAQTYLEHGNAPYLNRAFFQQVSETLAPHWLLFIAERDGRPIASSLIALSAMDTRARGQNDLINPSKVAYGRYWGSIERVDCLHFEACYYQPLQWCIDHGYQRFEGGAQGEHKMARALLPVQTTSAHWLAHPDFANAVADFLEREGAGIDQYLGALHSRSPFKQRG